MYMVVHPERGEHQLATRDEVAAQLREWMDNDELDRGIYVVEASDDPDTDVGPNVPLSSFLPELEETFPDA